MDEARTLPVAVVCGYQRDGRRCRHRVVNSPKCAAGHAVTVDLARVAVDPAQRWHAAATFVEGLAPLNAAQSVTDDGVVLVRDEDGALTPLRCDWIIPVPSGCPEPDSPEDLWLYVPCGLPMLALAGYEDVGARTCENGHTYLGLEAESRLDWEREDAERRGW